MENEVLRGGEVDANQFRAPARSAKVTGAVLEKSVVGQTAEQAAAGGAAASSEAALSAAGQSAALVAGAIDAAGGDECEVCMDNIAPDDAARQTCPSSRLCASCFRNYVDGLFGDDTNLAKLRCPAHVRCEPSRADKHVFTVEEMDTFAEAGLMTRAQKISIQQKVTRTAFALLILSQMFSSLIVDVPRVTQCET